MNLTQDPEGRIERHFRDRRKDFKDDHPRAHYFLQNPEMLECVTDPDRKASIEAEIETLRPEWERIK